MYVQTHQNTIGTDTRNMPPSRGNFSIILSKSAFFHISPTIGTLPNQREDKPHNPHATKRKAFATF